MEGHIANLAKATRSFWHDTDGVILPYVTVMLVVIVGTSLLALDGGRYMSLQSQLQKGADALAIAGAAELDRMPDSTDRAVNAVNNLITNSSVFGTGGAANVTDSQIRFMSTLPDDSVPNVDAHVICTGNACTPAQSVAARFVEVTVTPTTIPTILPASFVANVANTVTAGARATAGMDQVVCDFTPMFVCNPYSTAGMTYDQATAELQAAVADPAKRRRQIEMRRGGGGDGHYSPGNYGFLDNPTLGNGANALRDAIAMVSPTACFRQSGVDTKPGFVASVRDAVNVRFDIYEGPMSGSKNNSNFRPAMNVRKGYLTSGKGGGAACNAQPAPPPIPGQEAQAPYLGLPRDNCFASTCPYMGGRMGDGNWNFEAYWTVNHSPRPAPTVDGAQWSNANLPSRYAVYRYEIDFGFIGDLSGQAATTPPPNPEIGAPICSGSAPSDEPDRRTFYSAIVNCEANLPPSLPLGPGSQSGVPVAAFAKFFITQPVSAAQEDIMAEIVELVTPGSAGGNNFDQVQLYR
jgi:Flp pilus assembly protein TadG